MSNSGFLLTDDGLADAAASSPGGPYLHVHSFRIGSGVNYNPTRGQKSLKGNILYTGTPLTYTVLDTDTIDVVLQMDNSVGPFDFGEIGLYSTSNVLLAVCTFSELQSKVRTIGNQAGNIWRVHARIKLAQAPAICMVTVINSSSLLEVPNWSSLPAPQNMVSQANAVIVHEQNVSGDSVLVIRENALEWATVGYGRVFNGTLSDNGASANTSTLTHPNLPAVYMELPQASVSRYLIRFADGSIRRIVSQTGSTNVTWTPGLGAIPTGAFSIWEDNTTLNSGIPVASAYEYNYLANDINRYWALPSGTYNATNAGLNQNAIPLVTTRPTQFQWSLVQDALTKLMKLLNAVVTPVPVGDIVPTDFVAKPNNPNVPGVATLTKLYDKYVLAAANLNNVRNQVQPAWLENVPLSNTVRSRTSAFANSVEYNCNLTWPPGGRDGLANGGGSLVLTSNANTGNIFHTQWNAFLSQIGSIIIDRGSIRSSLNFGSPGIYGLLNMPSTQTIIYQASSVNASLGATMFYRVYGFRPAGSSSVILTIQLQLVHTGSYTYTNVTGGQITHAVSMIRPSATLINNPVMPTPSVIISGNFG